MIREPKPVDWVIRAAHPVEDRAFIMNSWLRTFEESPFRPRVPSREFFSCHHDTIERLLKDSSVLVASTPNQILGYICFANNPRPRILHWLYVRHKSRRLGVARSLVQAWLQGERAPIIYSHRTRSGDAFAPHVFSSAEWNPYMMHIPWPEKLLLPT